MLKPAPLDLTVTNPRTSAHNVTQLAEPALMQPKHLASLAAMISSCLTTLAWKAAPTASI